MGSSRPESGERAGRREGGLGEGRYGGCQATAQRAAGESMGRAGVRSWQCESRVLWWHAVGRHHGLLEEAVLRFRDPLLLEAQRAVLELRRDKALCWQESPSRGVS